ncbi:MAG: response regulator transcription factor [Flavipsychrobacter sp.]|nr:response regulator transcription factor [Flavipsychrobacter sp.]
MSHEIKCVIIDDEAKAIDLLHERLGILFPNINVVGTFTEWKKALEVLRMDTVNLVFLDISMPEKSGIDLLKLFPDMPFQVIFVTAHSEYAMEAIKFSAAGYVLKPIEDYELSFAVNKAIDRIKGVNQGKKPFVPESGSGAIKIGIPNLKGIDYLNASEILYFESVNKYTKVVTKSYSIVSSYNLGEFKKLVDDANFFQVHRSYIVNLHSIKRFETSGVVVMDDNMQIPVSKGIRNEFNSVFSKITRTAGLKSRNAE